MVEIVSDKFICIVDDSKLSKKGLGPGFPLPVEITPFCYEHTIRIIEQLPSLRGAVCLRTLCISLARFLFVYVFVLCWFVQCLGLNFCIERMRVVPLCKQCCSCVTYRMQGGTSNGECGE